MGQISLRLALIAIVCWPLHLTAATITFGVDGIVDLLPNTNNQIVYVDVSGGELAAGAVLHVMIGDGGQFLDGVNGGKPLLRDVRLSGHRFGGVLEHERLVFSGRGAEHMPQDLRLIHEPPLDPPAGYIGYNDVIVPADGEGPLQDFVVPLSGHLAALLVETVGLAATDVDQWFGIRAWLPPNRYNHGVATELVDWAGQHYDVEFPDAFLRIRGTGPAEASSPAIPEPASFLLAGMGAVAMAVLLRRARPTGTLHSILGRRR